MSQNVNHISPDLAGRQKLASLISLHTINDGELEVFPGVRLLRISSCDPVPTRDVSKPVMCIVAQGAKRVVLGNEVFEYDHSRMVVYSAEVPFSATIINASREAPYLCLIIDIAPNKLAELMPKVFANEPPRVQQARAIHIGPTDPKIIDAGCRLLQSLAEPDDAELLIPLVIDEIYIRLLRSHLGVLIAQMGVTDSNLHKISKAISWLRDHYAEPMKVDWLAAHVNMSISSFHYHFKAVASMSPLQFQKELRLHRAKNLMLSKMMAVSAASTQVGYASVSQFSREYSRLFGASPSKDIQQQMTHA